MIDVIQKENIEWEKAREGNKISRDEKFKMQRIEFFDEREREFEDIELRRLRRIADFN